MDQVFIKKAVSALIKYEKKTSTGSNKAQLFDDEGKLIYAQVIFQH